MKADPIKVYERREFDRSRLGGYSNYKKKHPYRDFDTRPFNRERDSHSTLNERERLTPESQSRGTKNNQTMWKEDETGYGLKSSSKTEAFPIPGQKSYTDKVLPFERSSSTEKPSTSTVDSKMSAPGEIEGSRPRLRKLQLETEANFEKRNIILTEPREECKLILEEGELDDDTFSSKKIKASESSLGSLPKFNRTFNQEIRSL